MKFRIKYLTQIYFMTVDDIQEDQLIVELKNRVKTHISSLQTGDFHLSLNGKSPLNENQSITQSGLVNGDTIYIMLKDLNRNRLSVSSLNQPLTLDEVRDCYTYPILIHRLLEYTQPDSDFDYMVVVLHALMLECGFLMDAENHDNLKKARKSSTFYVIRYRHKLCDQERLRCSLAIMKTDSLVTIDGIVNSISQACGKLSFPIGNYLHTQKEAMALNPGFPYHDLRQLSRLFKDSLANRLLCKLLEESGQQSSATLIGLPNEIKLRLAKYLPIKSLLILQSTCRNIYNTFNDNLLWHDLCQRDFDKTALTTIDLHSHEKNWHKLYRIIHNQKQVTLRHQLKSSPMFHPAIFPLLPASHPTHRVLFPDPTNGTPAGFHHFSPAIYRPIPSGIFRICPANTQQAQTPQQQQQQQHVQHHLHCQPYFGLKWVVIFAAATMIPFPPGFHPVWLG